MHRFACPTSHCWRVAGKVGPRLATSPQATGGLLRGLFLHGNKLPGKHVREVWKLGMWGTVWPDCTWRPVRRLRTHFTEEFIATEPTEPGNPGHLLRAAHLHVSWRKSNASSPSLPLVSSLLPHFALQPERIWGHLLLKDPRL